MTSDQQRGRVYHTKAGAAVVAIIAGLLAYFVVGIGLVELFGYSHTSEGSTLVEMMESEGGWTISAAMFAMLVTPFIVYARLTRQSLYSILASESREFVSVLGFAFGAIGYFGFIAFIIYAIARFAAEKPMPEGSGLALLVLFAFMVVGTPMMKLGIDHDQ